jgi:hypothetical protein
MKYQKAENPSQPKLDTMKAVSKPNWKRILESMVANVGNAANSTEANAL